MPAIQDPRTAKEPRTPTAGRMKKPRVDSGPARELGCCRGTYPPPAAGRMVTAFALDQKSRRRRGAPPPAALDGINIAQVFGSKRSIVQQTKIFCHLKDQFAVPPQGSLFGNVDRIRRPEQGVRALPIVQLHKLHPFSAAGQTFSCTNSRPHSFQLSAVDLRQGAQCGICNRVSVSTVTSRRAAVIRRNGGSM